MYFPFKYTHIQLVYNLYPKSQTIIKNSKMESAKPPMSEADMSELSEAMTEAINGIPKGDITELKSLHNPPE